MTEISLPWFFVAAFVACIAMSAYHFGRWTEWKRTRRQDLTFRSIFLEKRSRAK